jgi:hypothetical protein
MVPVNVRRFAPMARVFPAAPGPKNVPVVVYVTGVASAELAATPIIMTRPAIIMERFKRVFIRSSVIPSGKEL